MNVEILAKRADQLGEGMLCLPNEGTIYWVDILGKKMMRGDPNGCHIETFDFDTEIGAVLPGADGHLIVVLRDEVARFCPETGSINPFWSVKGQEPASNRFNDAAIDPQGNLWVGSMDFDAEIPSGNIYRISATHDVETIDQGMSCVNGPAFSPDGRTIYIGDTMQGRVFAYDCDPKTGAVDNKRLFVQFGPFDGLPDGMTVDAEGNLWICQVTAGRIGCYSPRGERLSSVALPVPMVTSCCFGGADLSTLYVTTARIILDDTDLAAYPQSGSLYSIHTNTRGLSPNAFGQDCGDIS